MSNTQEQTQTETQIVLPKGGDKSKGAKYIAEHPEEFGFSWKTGKLGRGSGKDYVEYNYDFPYIEVSEQNVLLFLASFGPALVSDALGGTSIKVSTDRVNRAAYDKDNKISEAKLKELLVSSVLLKVITRSGGTTTKFVDAKGNVYASKEAMEKAVANQAKIDALEAAQKFLSQASDNGVDPIVARNMAKEMWPLAFEKQASTDVLAGARKQYEASRENGQDHMVAIETVRQVYGADVADQIETENDEGKLNT